VWLALVVLPCLLPVVQFDFIGGPKGVGSCPFASDTFAGHTQVLGIFVAVDFGGNQIGFNPCESDPGFAGVRWK